MILEVNHKTVTHCRQRFVDNIKEAFDTNRAVSLGSKDSPLFKIQTKTPVSDNGGCLHSCCRYRDLR